MCRYCGKPDCPAACPNYEPEIVYTCSYCSEPIFEGDKYYDFTDFTECRVCEDCLADYLLKHVREGMKDA